MLKTVFRGCSKRSIANIAVVHTRIQYLTDYRSFCLIGYLHTSASHLRCTARLLVTKRGEAKRRKKTGLLAEERVPDWNCGWFSLRLLATPLISFPSTKGNTVPRQLRPCCVYNLEAENSAGLPTNRVSGAIPLVIIITRLHSSSLSEFEAKRGTHREREKDAHRDTHTERERERDPSGYRQVFFTTSRAKEDPLVKLSYQNTKERIRHRSPCILLSDRQ